MAQIDFSLQNRIPDGNGKLLVGDLSPTDGSYTTEQQYLEWMKGKILYSGYLYNGDFYKESAHTNVISKVDGAIYVDLSDGTNLSLYYCDNTTYKPLTEEAQVQAIIDGLNDGTIVPLKAKQDQNGNVIDQTYETKADASDLKAAIQANSKRITNLEVKAGDEIPVTYPSATYGMDGVPASVAPYGKVRELIGVSRVKNNLCSAGSVTNSTTDTRSYISFYVRLASSPYTTLFSANISSTGRMVFLATASFSGRIEAIHNGVSSNIILPLGEPINVVSGHMYLMSMKVNGYDPTTVGGISLDDIIITDLTLYFNGNIPSNADTVAHIAQYYPELLIPSDYDTGTIVSTTYSAVKSVGRNLFDGTWEDNKAISNSTGATYSINGYSITDYIKVDGVSSYYTKVDATDSTASSWVMALYDADKTFIRSLQHQVTANWVNRAVALTGASFVHFMVSSTYKSNVCFNLSDALNGTFTPYLTDTLTLPTPVTGKSAGSVHQIYYPETGEMTEPLGEKTSGYNWTLSEYGYWRSDVISDIKYNDGNTPANVLCDKYVTYSSATLVNTSGLIGIAQASTGRILARTGDLVNAPNISILYELATPNPNSQATDPMPDPFIKVGGGGTIRPVQTQTTQIDSAMSVDYLGV